MKLFLFGIAFLSFFCTNAQNPIGASYQSIYDRFNNKFFIIEEFEINEEPSIKGLRIKEGSAPFNTHIFYFEKVSNECTLYFLSFSKASECVAATSVLNGIFRYRISNLNGECQWYDPDDPTFKIIIINTEDGGSGLVYKKEDMSKLD